MSSEKFRIWGKYVKLKSKSANKILCKKPEGRARSKILMAGIRVTVSFPSAASAAVLLPRRSGWPLRTAISTFSSSAADSVRRRQLVLYTKPGCCLCEGLKEKLQAAISLGGPNNLQSVELQVRDISGNPLWEKLYQDEIPVLAKVLLDGTEETLPRLSPRLGVELIQKKIAAAFDLK
ncbi:hypothetical protein HPP92_003798 [Vanilla planifolia]|uniref:Glutaredoxin-like protein n=1 Tax=Vanilla planifolia TaxID=51239 RepID=A0A835VNZ9_VANPL|nr:hypothetical protein HPP92_003798 [Vanilla planifolia]